MQPLQKKLMNFILEMRGIEKIFNDVIALDGVSVQVRRGDIHAIVGENGAGKSTLMSILCGLYPYGSYSGEIEYQEKIQQFVTINDSEKIGISIIHQEFALTSQLSIAENIFLGNEPNRFHVIDWELMHEKTCGLLKKVGLNESPETLISHLDIGKQQLVAIAKALSKKQSLLILDEPTAYLNEPDSDAVLKLLVELKQQGITLLLISHKLNKIVHVADALTILRNGKVIDSIDCHANSINEDHIIEKMMGRKLADRYPQRIRRIGSKIFEVQHWQVDHPPHVLQKKINCDNLYVNKGEIIGISGLRGAGHTELALSVFGHSYGQCTHGRAFKNGQEIDVSSVEKAISHGLAYVTEDRKDLGLWLTEDIKKNISLANLSAVSTHLVINETVEYQVADYYRQQLNIRCSDLSQKVMHLSGGNQQKIVLAKWLFSKPDILILNESSRGLDIGSKYDIYILLNEFVQEGKGVIMISSNVSELFGLCDRIYLMHEGCVVGEFTHKEQKKFEYKLAHMEKNNDS